MEFSSSLLREKFTIQDPDPHQDTEERLLLALSNRMVVDLKSLKGDVETFVIRSHNMHLAARMCARLVYSYQKSGPIMARPSPYDWGAAWDALLSDYEYSFNPNRWIAIYHKGKQIYKWGEHHPLLDIIEKCDFSNDQEYEHSVAMAESIFKAAGKTVNISYEGNVALVVDFDDTHGKCAIILRGAERTTTFNFTCLPRKQPEVNIPQCIAAAAAFLEGMQLAFQVGMSSEKIHLGIIERFSHEEKQYQEGKPRLAKLSAEIANLEAVHNVRYRPEKPSFKQTMLDAERLARKVLKPPPPKPKKDGDGNEIEQPEEEQWVE